MKTLTLPLITLILASACAGEFPQKSDNQPPSSGLLGDTMRNAFKARITFYYAGEDPKWGSQVSDPAVKRAEEGVTVAAERQFPFGTVFEIPILKGNLDSDGYFIVQDRGTAVQSRKASRGRTPVVDVYVKDRATYLKMTKETPAYAIVVLL